MTFDRRRGELSGSLSAPPRFTQLSTMTTNLLNLTDTTDERPKSAQNRGLGKVRLRCVYGDLPVMYR